MTDIYFPSILEAKIRIKVSAVLASGEDCPTALQMATFFLCTHINSSLYAWCLFLFSVSSSSHKDTNPIRLGTLLLSPLILIISLKALAPNKVAWGLGLQHIIFERNIIQSTTGLMVI